jgi:transposase
MKKLSRLESPEPLWKILEAFIPVKKVSHQGGRPSADLRKVVDGIFYAIRTGIPWSDMPRAYASSSTCHRYFQEWQEQGVFQMAWAECLARYDKEFGIDWSKLNIGSSQAKAPLGGEKKPAKAP